MYKRQNYARKGNFLKEKDDALSGEDCREGLTAIISVKHPDPQYEGQTKTKLGNAEVRKIASNIISKSLDQFLLENPDTAKIIVEKAIVASHARLAAKKAREMTRRKTGRIVFILSFSFKINQDLFYTILIILIFVF